eukprot:129449_1
MHQSVTIKYKQNTNKHHNPDSTRSLDSIRSRFYQIPESQPSICVHQLLYLHAQIMGSIAIEVPVKSIMPYISSWFSVIHGISWKLHDSLIIDSKSPSSSRACIE